MRTIDVDELKKKLEAEHCDCEIMALIDDIPTIAEAANAEAACMSKAHTIMEHYGARHQLMKLCEECGELIQQAAKCTDKETDYNEDMIEEMADVTIMIMQFMSILPQVDYALFRQIIREKLDRQIERIESEEGSH